MNQGSCHLIVIKLKLYLQSEKIDKQKNEPTKTYDDSEPTQINPLASLVFFSLTSKLSTVGKSQVFFVVSPIGWLNQS